MRARAVHLGMVGATGVVAVALGLLLGSCAGLATAPPPAVTEDLLDRGRGQGFTADRLAHGREVFIARCAECHALPAIQARTDAEWEVILPRMARKSRLCADDAEAVRAFVLAARAALEEPTHRGSGKAR